MKFETYTDLYCDMLMQGGLTAHADTEKPEIPMLTEEYRECIERSLTLAEEDDIFLDEPTYSLRIQ